MGSVAVDSPGDGVARVTFANEAKRNALVDVQRKRAADRERRAAEQEAAAETVAP